MMNTFSKTINTGFENDIYFIKLYYFADVLTKVRTLLITSGLCKL